MDSGLCNTIPVNETGPDKIGLHCSNIVVCYHKGCLSLGGGIGTGSE